MMVRRSLRPAYVRSPAECVRRGTLAAGRLDGRRYAPRVAKTRLDALLVDRGLFESRSRAAAAVLAGTVWVGGHGERAQKPGQLVSEDVELAVDAPAQYVSRGGIKLANALDALGLDVTGRRALDVAYGELHVRLRDDSRVTVIERFNARSLASGVLPYAPDLVVIDVSFISLTKVLPAVLPLAAARFDCLAMVKPQFEVGRDRVGKGGVVRSPDDRREAVATVARLAREDGWSVMGFAPSGLPGPAGNRETFVWLAESGRRGGDATLEDVDV